MTWKKSPTWPASFQGRLLLAADTDIFVSPSVPTSESFRLGWGERKKDTRKVQGIQTQTAKNETKIWLGKFFGGKMLLLRSL